MNYSELLQLAKGWGNFLSDRIIIWRLPKTREEIFEECNAIRFFSCLHEYFLYKEDIKEAYIKACLKCEDIIATLYHLYIKYEYLRYSRWEDIDEILNALVREQEDDRGTILQQE